MNKKTAKKILGTKVFDILQKKIKTGNVPVKKKLQALELVDHDNGSSELSPCEEGDWTDIHIANAEIELWRTRTEFLLDRLYEAPCEDFHSQDWCDAVMSLDEGGCQGRLCKMLWVDKRWMAKKK